jgi:hypothetical protein
VCAQVPVVLDDKAGSSCLADPGSTEHLGGDSFKMESSAEEIILQPPQKKKQAAGDNKRC